MALSEDLKVIYTAHEESRQFYDAIELNHPNFTTTHYLIRNDIDMTLKLDDDVTPALFRSYPFNIIVPEVGSDQQDLGIVFDHVSLEFIDELELAIENPEIPIELKYRVYIDGTDLNQISTITLSLTSINISMREVSATATRANLYERKFPFGKSSYYDARFRGLYL